MSNEHFAERVEALLSAEGNSSNVQWWLSFCDTDKPKGSQFLGVTIVEAPGFMHAVQLARAHGANPGGEVQGYETKDVPKELLNKLLSKEDLEAADLI